jgi:tetratricopeptide (TPR) repeat protein
VFDVAVPKRFRLLRRLGEGGMGVVYEALDEERGARVALKTIRKVTPATLARFKKEFRVLQDVHHPNLVALGELVSEADQWFFTMELVLGGDFIDYVRPIRASRTRLVRSTESTITDPAGLAAGGSRRAPAVHDGELPFEEERLRDALRQLVLALVTLHAAGLVHRDIKPSNIRVSDDGRVVVLDFGLVSDFTSARYSTEAKVVGTPAYMAPEQAAGGAVGPEADWYSVGVLLYEALTGELPFEGAPLLVLMQKQQQEAPAPRRVVSTIPPDLDALCASLLAFDPRARPSEQTLLDLLDVRSKADGARGRSLAPPRGQPAPFVGRAAELEALRRAFHESRERGAVSLFLRGESGVGKSGLVRRFAEIVSAEDPDALVLPGRCYESESVPYKAFDGVIDALARSLSRLPVDAAARFVPTRPQALLRVFPVLKRVEAIAQAPREDREEADPSALRSRAFAVLRELLTRVADRYPLVVVIRDLQWADADSLAMLADLLRPPDAPSLLLVGTVRAAAPDADGRGDLLAAIPGDKRVLDLRGLSEEEATELARSLLLRAASTQGVSGKAGPPEQKTQDAQKIAQEAGGHPLFIDALVSYGALTAAPAGVRLEEAIGWRVENLEPETRLILELVAVAGAPTAQGVLAVAAAEESEPFARRVASLRVAHLVSVTGVRGSDTVEPYHDRIRLAVLDHLAPGAREALHRRLALAFERSGGLDPETLAIHWAASGDTERGGVYAADAGDRAATALAFDVAARLYERALAARSPGPARKVLEHKLGDALAAGGWGARAAAAYVRAAEGAQAATALELRRRAAEQLFRSGHFDEGLAAMSDVLASIGMRLPRSPAAALVALVFWRALLRLRGLGFKPRDASQLTAHTLTRVDACWSVAGNLSTTDYIRGAAFQARHMLLALGAGEPLRVVRALALEAVYRSAPGGDVLQRVRPLLDRLAALAEELGQPQVKGWVDGAAGFAHLYRGDFRPALQAFERAGDVWSAQCAGVAWENDIARTYELICLANLGRLRELQRRTESHLRAATERGDLFAAVNSRIGSPALRWLAADDPDTCRRDTLDALAEWSRSGFHVAHYWALEALTNADLYAGAGFQAYERIHRRWRELEASMLLRIQLIRIQARLYRGRAALAAAAESRDGEALLGIAIRDALAVEREGMPWAAPHAALLAAGVAAVRKREEEVVPLLRDAAKSFGASGMRLHEAIAQRHLGRYLGGSAGQALVRVSETWLASESIRNAERISRMLAPAL